MKEIALTRGGLPNHWLDWEKSAEVIVAAGIRAITDKWRPHRCSEGLNVK
jgi:hypothetical protein